MKLWTSVIQIFLAFASIWDQIEGKVADADYSEDKRQKRWAYGGPPQFHPDSPINVTSQLGGSAYLPCRIKNLGNKSVSWIRSRDSHILTVDRYTFIADDRFVAWHDRATRSWTLMVRYVQDRDAGRYECQISTEPKMSHFVTLDIIRPRVEISSKKDIYVKSGSQVSINCTIFNSLEIPQYIFWYHDGRRIVAGDPNRDMRVQHFKDLHTTVGSFSIRVASINDSGNYTCEPAGLTNATVDMHVLAGEKPAGLHTNNSSAEHLKPSSLKTFLLILSFLFFLNAYNTSSKVLKLPLIDHTQNIQSSILISPMLKHIPPSKVINSKNVKVKVL